MIFENRADAGRALAQALSAHRGDAGVVVLALPRGGVPVGFEVARALNAPLDIFLVRKLGVPGHEELAMGAIASGGVRVVNRNVIQELDITVETLDAVTANEQRELERRERAYRDNRPPLDVRGKTVILVDDGLATGASMRAAVMALRQRQPAQIIVAVPVASPETCDDFRDKVDDIVCAQTPQPFYGVGLWYRNFEQISDGEVRELLARAARLQPPVTNRP